MASLRTRLALIALLGAPAVALAQTAAPTPGLKPGDDAPDFTLPVSTAAGVGKLPASLRDFRGQTVILAFFFKVRTSG